MVSIRTWVEFSKTDSRIDKNYWLYKWRIHNRINDINHYAALIAEGKES